MLVGGILIAVVAVTLVGTIISRRLTQDDEHSVQGYHRQLHTLEHISVHPVEAVKDSEEGDGAKPAYPESAIRLAGPRTVRVTDATTPVVPPVPPPPVPNPEAPVRFDDETPTVLPSPASVSSAVRGFPGLGDKAMSTMNRRPRRLAAPALAVAAVAVLVVVLLVTGSHKVPPAHHGSAASGHSTGHTAKRSKKKKHSTSTTTTPALVVSAPETSSAHSATYTVTSARFTLIFSATSSPCWVDAANDATDAAAGATLFSGVLEPGQQETVSADGPVTVEIGAPSSFAATVDGTEVTLPVGYQTPFAMHLVPATTASSTTG